MTAHKLQQDRPFLFQAIVTVATPSKEQRQARSEGLKHVLAKMAVVENESSIDMLLGILTYITWSTDPFLKRTSSLSRMVMMAISVVYDLQRDQRMPPEAHVMAKMAPGLRDVGQIESNAPPTDWLEEQRAFLACFMLSSMYVDLFLPSKGCSDPLPHVNTRSPLTTICFKGLLLL